MKKLTISVSLTVLVMAITFIALPRITEANPSAFLPTTQTAAATTSVSYLAPGTATTTLVAPDAYANGQNKAIDSQVLLVQFAASSTASVLNINFEYSQGNAGINCTLVGANCDWYQNDLNGTFQATTSPSTVSVVNVNALTWTFASSTVGGTGLTTTNGATSTKIFNVQSPTRYVRAVFTMTGSSGAIWAQFVPQRETVN